MSYSTFCDCDINITIIDSSCNDGHKLGIFEYYYIKSWLSLQSSLTEDV